MKHYLQYEIHLEEPVKMGRQGNQTNTESLNYIAGSAIRGAVIGLCLKRKSEADIESTLLKKIYFYDAYLKGKDGSAIPMPAVYYADKHAVRRAEKKAEETGQNGFAVHSCAFASETPKEGEQRVDIGKYCVLEEDRVLVKKVRKNANLHIALAREEKDSQMFRYEAIDSGQIFVGVIGCEEEKMVTELKKMLDGEILYLGGSRGSGYGRCGIKNIKAVSWETLREQYSPKAADRAGELTVYALSNLILTDGFGKPTGNIDTKFLENYLGLRAVKLQEAYISVFRTYGFNHTWRARQIQQSAVSAGSVYIFSYEGELCRERLRELEEEGLGVRRQEGFGRILINPLLSQTKRENAAAEEPEEKLPPLDDENRGLLAELADRIYENRNSESIERAAYDTAEKSREIVRKFSLTQMNRLETLLYELQILPRKEAEEKIERFLTQEIRTKTKASYDAACMHLPNGEKRTMKTILQEVMAAEATLVDWGVVMEESEKQIFEDIAVRERDCFLEKCRFLQAVLHHLSRMEGGRT